jgi:EF-P beta-lysylation protein EpmB
MITASLPTRHPTPNRWQTEMAQAITSPEALIEALGLDPALIAPARAAAAQFGLRVPLGYVARMRRGDASDPLLRQVLPIAAEGDVVPEFGPDPIGEQSARRAPGLLQKYQGRALLITTSACAIHCRYCFRREFPYSEQASPRLPLDQPLDQPLEQLINKPTRFREALDEIASDPSLEEIILSGGDPLSLSDSRLTSLTDELAKIPHIRRLRLHTRQPVVLPSRVDAGLTAWLQRLPWPVVFVLHANHANEIDDSVRAACAHLREHGVTLLNQAVLLKGVNDNADALVDLSRALFDAGVLPYYLHVLDKVTGAAHFDLPEARAQELAGELAARLSGYLVPRLVREVEGAPAKLSLAPRFIAK